MLRIKNCDDLVKNLNTLMCIDIGTIAVLFNINTDNEITLVKLLESYYYFQEGLHGIIMSMYFCVMSVLCVLLINSAAILFRVHT